MKKEEKEKIYKKAIDKWGIPLQIIMLIEECAELQKEMTKMLRKGITKKEMNEKVVEVAEEVADVEIMLGQLDVFYKHLGINDFRKIANKFKEAKLKRLKKMLR